jgi:ankyrin repeat protein
MPIHYAAKYGHLAMVTMLLDHGSPVDTQNKVGIRSKYVFVCYSPYYILPAQVNKINLPVVCALCHTT